MIIKLLRSLIMRTKKAHLDNLHILWNDWIRREKIPVPFNESPPSASELAFDFENQNFSKHFMSKYTEREWKRKTEFIKSFVKVWSEVEDFKKEHDND